MIKSLKLFKLEAIRWVYLKDLDTPIDYKSLASIGSMMGSGMLVLDETDCMVDIARFFRLLC